MKQKLLQLVLLALLVLPFTSPPAEAAPVEYGREFGLFVHEQNRNLNIPKAKAEQVLASYFVGVPLKANATEINQFMSQREFLVQFEKLRLEADDGNPKISDDLLYYSAWLKARRYNWLPVTRLTYDSMREFLYRYSVSEKFDGIPYFEGLVLDEEEISPQNFTSIREVRAIQTELHQRAEALRELKAPSRREKALLNSLDVYYERYSGLETQLRELYHPLNQLPHLPEDIRQKIIDYDLNEILEQTTYNYAHNNANRIHNLVTGANQFSGQVYMPDEVINLEEELGRDGWWKYKYGWVIFGGTEEWQFGGGLCGSATIVFTPSWRAGLEVIRRFPHSVYYRNLYPEESLGLDATIYRGHKNLIMRNTTGSPLLYYLVNDPDKKEVTMYLIGNSPYRDIAIEGPIKEGWNTYKWIRRMERFDGTVVEDAVVTRYGVVY